MQSRDKKPYLIGIAGASGSGKTSVANIILKYVGRSNCLLFSMDSYYKELSEKEMVNVSQYNFDSPDAIDLDLLSLHLESVMNWNSIEMPIYNFALNKRENKTQSVSPNKIIIFEGILAFYDKRIRDQMNMKIFVDLDRDICLSRRSN